MERKPEKLHISRQVYHLTDLNEKFKYEKTHTSVWKHLTERIKRRTLYRRIKDFIPILHWWPLYNFKENIYYDIVTGLSLGVTHISQATAFSLLAGTHTVNGFYTSVIPVFLYCLIGTGRHLPMGGHPVICILIGRITLAYKDEEERKLICTVIPFVVGVMLFLSSFIQAGDICNLFSDTLISAFFSATGFHIFVPQLKHIFGVEPEREEGDFRIIKEIIHVHHVMYDVSWLSIVIAIVTMIVLIINHAIITPWLKKYAKFPIPMEIIIVCFGIIASYCFDLKKNFGITIVGDIPTGFPIPAIPRVSLIPQIFLNSIHIAIVSYSLSMQMNIMYANRFKYKVHPHTELFAMGTCNIVGSFFGSIPICASVTRSSIFIETGGKSAISSLVSCGFILLILLWFARCIEPLPKCVVAGIIVASLFDVFVSLKDVVKFWYLSKWDFVIWVTTFLTTLIFGIDIGLYVGIYTSFMSIFIRGYMPYTCLLGNLPGTELYLDTSKFKNIEEPLEVSIFRFCGSLDFSTSQSFELSLYKSISFNADKAVRLRRSGTVINPKIKCIILDFSPVNHIDPHGILTMVLLQEKLDELEIKLYIASCAPHVFEVLMAGRQFYPESSTFFIFATIHDAWLYYDHMKMKGQSRSKVT